MKIQPLSGMIQLQIDEAKAGVLDTSSRASAVEFATVLAVGEGIESIKAGDRVFVKAWGCDIINHEDKKYYFVHIDSKAILAIVK